MAAALLVLLGLAVQDPHSLQKSAREKQERGDLKGALADLDAAIKMAPRHSVGIILDRGHLRQSLGDYEGAEADATVALEIIAPTMTLFRAQVFELRGFARMSQGKFKGADADMSEAVKLAPENWLYWSDRGIVRSVGGQPAKAVEDFTEAIKRSPKNSTAHSFRGQARAQLGDIDGALEDTTKAITLDPKTPYFHTNRGEVHSLARRWKEALADYRKAVEVAPQYHVYVAGAIWILRARLGEKEEATKELKQALKEMPVNEDRPFPLKSASYLAGDLTKEELLKAADSKNPFEARMQKTMALYAIALRHVVSGEKAEARKILKECIQVGGKGPLTRQAELELKALDSGP